MRIPTLEGIMEARLGDWIIRGVKGEVYPCKPDIFVMTYDPAEDEQFCRHCGAGKGIHRRVGEGTCPKCDPEGRHVKLLRDLAQAVITEYNVCVGGEGPSWDLCHQAETALSELVTGDKA